MPRYRTAIVGQKETVQGFALLGVDIRAAYSHDEAMHILHRLKKSTVRDAQGKEHHEYAIVFVTEDLLSGMSADDERRLSRGALPAIIALPSHHGSSGYSMQRLQRIVERAVGSNILQ